MSEHKGNTDGPKRSIMPKMVEASSRSEIASLDRSVSGGSSQFSKSSSIAGSLQNIKDGVSPFNSDNGDVDVRDAIVLSRKAYWNVSIYRLTIDIMSEFANSPLHFKSKNKTANKFFESWYKQIGGDKLADQFFRELFRSSNIFLKRVEGTFTSRNRGIVKIPSRYLVLDSAEIKCDSAKSFIDGSSFKKVLNEFESEVLRNSKDPRVLEFKKSLGPKIRKELETTKRGSVSIPLTADEVIPVFYKKQDYEPLAVPIFFPVLFDINLKLEFKKAEQIIARACEYMILLITVGDKDLGVDQELVDYIQTLFQTESVGRVLVSDWTTNMDFVLPDLKKILGPEKYESVNKDIANGLMNIFFGESKYADSMAKISIFLERLKEARKVYLRDFLIPEMEKICETMGYRECPVAEFEAVDLKDEVEYLKLYNRLAEMGFLTDKETFDAYNTHMLPEKYDSLVSQEQFKEEKDDGLYAPISQGSGGIDQPAGRPTGTPQNQKNNKKVTPQGGKASTYSAEKLKDVALKVDKLIKASEKKVKDKFDIKRMSKKYKDISKTHAYTVIQNEKEEDWFNKLEEYMDKPLTVGPIFNEVGDLASDHSIGFVEASLLYHSKS